MPILDITAPIFLVIALGYGAVRLGFFARGDVATLSAFALRFTLPALIFRALAQRPLREIADAGYLVGYAGASLAVFALVFVVSRTLQGTDTARSALKAMAASVANSGFIGFPIVLAAMGPADAGLGLALNMLIENLIMIPLTLAIAESGGRAGETLPRMVLDTARRLAGTPMIQAIVVGLLFSLSGLGLPLVLTRTIDMLAGASATVSLFAIGGALVGLRTGGMMRDIALPIVGKLVVHPLAVAAAMALLPGVTPDLRKMAVLFAAIPVLTLFPLLGERFGAQAMCSAILLVQIVLSFATVTALLAFL